MVPRFLECALQVFRGGAGQFGWGREKGDSASGERGSMRQMPNEKIIRHHIYTHIYTQKLETQ